MCVHVRADVYICIYTYTYTCVYIYISVCVCVSDTSTREDTCHSTWSKMHMYKQAYATCNKNMCLHTCPIFSRPNDLSLYLSPYLYLSLSLSLFLSLSLSPSASLPPPLSLSLSLLSFCLALSLALLPALYPSIDVPVIIYLCVDLSTCRSPISRYVYLFIWPSTFLTSLSTCLAINLSVGLSLYLSYLSIPRSSDRSRHLWACHSLSKPLRRPWRLHRCL